MTDKPDWLVEAEARCEAATVGPWESEFSKYGDEIWFGGYRGPGMYTVKGPDAYIGGERKPDAQFIAHARTDLPKAIAATKAADMLCLEAEAVASRVQDDNLWKATRAYRKARRGETDAKSG